MAGNIRNYVVDYQITANTQGAKENIGILSQQVQAFSNNMLNLQIRLKEINPIAKQVADSLKVLNVKPTIDVSSFKASLHEIEVNAVATANRVREILETALGGTRAAHNAAAKNMGKNIWLTPKDADRTSENELRAAKKALDMASRINEAKTKLNKALKEDKNTKTGGTSQTAMAVRDAQLRYNGLIKEMETFYGGPSGLSNVVNSILLGRGEVDKAFKANWKDGYFPKMSNILSKSLKGIEKELGETIGTNNTVQKKLNEGLVKATAPLGKTVGAFTDLTKQLSGKELEPFAQMLASMPKEGMEIKIAFAPNLATLKADFAAFIGELRALSGEGVGLNLFGAGGPAQKMNKLKYAGKSGLPTMLYDSKMAGLKSSYNSALKAADAGAIEKAFRSELINGEARFPATGPLPPWAMQEIERRVGYADANLMAAKSQLANHKWKPTPLTSNLKQPWARGLWGSVKGESLYSNATANGIVAPSISELSAQLKAANLASTIKLTIDKAALEASIKAIKLPALPIEITPIISKAASTAKQSTPVTAEITPDVTALKAKLAEIKPSITVELIPDVAALNAKIKEAKLTPVKINFTANIRDLQTKVKEAKFAAKKIDFTASVESLRNILRTSNLTAKVKVTATAKQISESLKKFTPTLQAKIKPIWGGNAAKANEMKRLSENIPPIKLRLDVSQAMETLNAFIARIREVSNQTIKLGTTAGRAINRAEKSATSAQTLAATGRGSRAGGTYGGGGIARPAAKSSWSRALYPLVGNTSLGANTPAAISMAKGFGVMYAVGGAMSGISSALSQAVDYQNTMETTRAILGRNYKGGNFNGDFGRMERIARQVGMDTKYTAPDVANAARFMAMAGLGINDIEGSIRPVADISLIGDNDLGEVADKLTNVQTAFGIRGGGQMRRLADQMANTFTQTNTDMMMIAESMQYAAPMAHLAGANVGDVLSMIGVMGNAGIQASMAGTTMRMMYQNIINPNKNQKKMWDWLGIKRTDANGAPRNMIDILSDIANNKKVGDNNLAEVVSKLFRVTASAGAGQLIEDLRQPGKGGISLVKMLQAQNAGGEINGLSADISEKKQNTVAGLWAQVTSAFTEDNVQMFEEFQGFIKGVLISLRDFMRSKEAIDSLRNVLTIIKEIAEWMGIVAKVWIKMINVAGPAIKFFIVAQFVMKQFGSILGMMLSVLRPFTGLFGVFGGAAAAGGVASGVGRAVAARGLGGAMATGAGAAVANTGLVAANLAGGWRMGMTRSTYANLTNIPRVWAAGPMPMPMLTNAEAAAGAFIAKDIAMYQRSRNYMMGGMSKHERALLNGTLNRKVATMRSMMPGMGRYPVIMPAGTGLERYPVWATGSVLAMTPYYRAGISQVMPFHQYSRGSQAVLWGGAPQMSKADRYRTLAGKWNTLALKKIQDRDAYGNLLNTYSYKYDAATRAAYIAKANKYYAAANVASAAMYGGLGRASVGRLQREAALVQALQNRRPGQLGNTALVARAMAMGKLSKANQIAALGAAFNSGTAAMSMAGLWGSIKTGFHSVILGLVKGFGMLLSPVGMVVTAMAALGVGIWALCDSVKKSQKNIDNLKKLNSHTPTIANKENANLLPEYVNYANGSLGKGKKRFATLAERAATSQLFNDPLHHFNKYTMADVYLGGRKNLKVGETFEQVRRRSILAALKDNGADPNTAAANHRYIKSLFDNAKGKGADAYAAAQKQAKAYAEKFNPDRYKGLIRAENIGDTDAIGNIDPRKTYEWHQGLYQSLLSDANGKSAWTQRTSGISQLKSGIESYSQEWWGAMGRAINGMKASVETVKGAVNITLQTLPNGTIDTSFIVAQVRKVVENFKLSLSAFANTVANVYAMLASAGAVDGKWFSSWRKFEWGQTQHNVVTATDAADYWDAMIGGGTWRGMNRQQYIDYISNPNNRGEAAKERVRIRKRISNNAADNAKKNWDKANKGLINGINSGTGSNDVGTTGTPDNSGAKVPSFGRDKGYDNKYGRTSGRPTQVNINIDKLAQFDHSQFLTADEQKMQAMIGDSTNDAMRNLLTMLAPIIHGMAGNDSGYV